MKERSAPARLRKHLHSPSEIAWAVGAEATVWTATGRHAGNGVRTHAVYIVVLSMVALSLFIGIIAAASSMP